MSTGLQAGVARANITPPVGCYLAGYGSARTDPATSTKDDHIAYPGPRIKPSAGINDDLFAKALVLDDGAIQVALVTLDLIGVDDNLVAQARALIQAATGIPGGHVLLGAAHTHAGPFTVAHGEGKLADPDYLSQLTKKIAGAASMAARSLAPATLSLGWGQAAIGVHRRVVTPEGTFMRPNPAGPVDRRVGVLRIDATEGSPLAILVHYTCHPNVLRHDNLLISADYVGVALDLLEQVYPGSTALFLQGCCGNVRPNLVGDDGDFRSGGETDRQRLGRILGAAAVKAAEQAVPLAPVRLKAASERVLLPLAEGREGPGGETGSVEAEMQALALGPLLLITIPGEPFVEIGQRIRQAVGDPVLVVGYANGYLGYLATSQAHTEGGYEVTTGPFAAQAEDALVAGALELAQELRRAPFTL